MALVIPADLRSYQSARPHDDVQGRHRGHRVSVLGTAFDGGGREFHFFYCADDDQLVAYRPPRQTGYTGIEYGTADSLFQRPGATHAGHTITRVGSYVRPNVGVEHVWFCQVDAKVLRQAVPGAVTPTLDLDFTQGVVDPRITFTRSSRGSIVGPDGRVQVLGTNAPRVDWHPVTGECLGLLVEESRTNLLLRSAEFDNAAWTKNHATVTPNQAMAPDGTMTADRIVYEDGGTNGYISQTVTTTPATAHTFSVWLRTDTPGVKIRVSAESTGLSGTYTEFTLTSEWVRYSVTKTGGAGTDWRALIYNFHADNAQVGPTIYAWGAQVEVGTFPTSYIPTTTEPVTRAADVATLAGLAPWFNPAEGAVHAEYSMIGFRSGIYLGVVSLDDGTANEAIHSRVNGTTQQASYSVADGGVQQAGVDSPVIAAGAAVRQAIGYKANDFAFAVNGAIQNADASGSLPAPTTAHLGCNFNNGGQLNGHIRRVTYYPRRLPNSLLQSLTE